MFICYLSQLLKSTPSPAVFVTSPNPEARMVHNPLYTVTNNIYGNCGRSSSVVDGDFDDYPDNMSASATSFPPKVKSSSVAGCLRLSLGTIDLLLTSIEKLQRNPEKGIWWSGWDLNIRLQYSVLEILPYYNIMKEKFNLNLVVFQLCPDVSMAVGQMCHWAAPALEVCSFAE